MHVALYYKIKSKKLAHILLYSRMMNPLSTQKTSNKEFFPEKYIKRSVKILKLSSDENRLRVMLYLAKHERAYVTEIVDALDLNQTTLSHHLSLLRTADLVVTIRNGKNI